ncbi:MAG: hypothetical protein AAGA72_18740 [Pseudomonadota bacterium]
MIGTSRFFGAILLAGLTSISGAWAQTEDSIPQCMMAYTPNELPQVSIVSSKIFSDLSFDLQAAIRASDMVADGAIGITGVKALIVFIQTKTSDTMFLSIGEIESPVPLNYQNAEVKFRFDPVYFDEVFEAKVVGREATVALPQGGSVILNYISEPVIVEMMFPGLPKGSVPHLSMTFAPEDIQTAWQLADRIQTRVSASRRAGECTPVPLP